MDSKRITRETGRAALSALFHEGSPLGPLKVMAKHVGNFFQIPLPGFRPFVVFGPEEIYQELVRFAPRNDLRVSWISESERGTS